MVKCWSFLKNYAIEDPSAALTAARGGRRRPGVDWQMELIGATILLLYLCPSAIGGRSGEDYVRPLPRETLSLPWRPMRSSDPQQVIVGLICSVSDYSLFFGGA